MIVRKERTVQPGTTYKVKTAEGLYTLRPDGHQWVLELNGSHYGDVVKVGSCPVPTPRTRPHLKYEGILKPGMCLAWVTIGHEMVNASSPIKQISMRQG